MMKYELETHLELPVTVEYSAEEGIEIINIKVKGVDLLVNDISELQYDTLIREIGEEMESAREDAAEFQADCEREGRLLNGGW